MSIPYFVTFPERIPQELRRYVIDQIREADRRGRPVVLDSGGMVHELSPRKHVSASFLSRARSRVR